jgi:hypothetical protein
MLQTKDQCDDDLPPTLFRFDKDDRPSAEESTSSNKVCIYDFFNK